MNEIEQLRTQISKVDLQLIELIAKRQKIAQKIGNYKKKNNMPVLDSAREALLREFHDTICAEHGLSAEIVAKIFEILIEESRKVQSDE
jgi:chorismate mutase